MTFHQPKSSWKRRFLTLAAVVCVFGTLILGVLLFIPDAAYADDGVQNAMTDQQRTSMVWMYVLTGVLFCSVVLGGLLGRLLKRRAEFS